MFISLTTRLFKTTIFLNLVLFIQSSLMGSIVNLDNMVQDFVLEMKQIHIPGHPYTFNPSIVHWQGNLLLSFRIHDPLTGSTNQFGLIWLDDNLNPASEPYIIEMRNKSAFLPPKEQDPRLIVHHDELYVIYNNIIGPTELEMRRMFIAKLQFENGRFFIENPEVLLLYDLPAKRMEKNWVPFIWEDQLLLAYSINPHSIMQPLYQGNRCTLIAKSSFESSWDWGELRGGTPALLEEGRYLAFFHSYKDMFSVQSEGKKISHYFMGAYTFNPNPPFEITHISDKPIIGSKFYRGPLYKTWKPLRVVFPGGFISYPDHIYVAYGRQDHEVWIAKMDKSALLDSLKPVAPNLN